jgi:hypothetical protein
MDSVAKREESSVGDNSTERMRVCAATDMQLPQSAGTNW